MDYGRQNHRKVRKMIAINYTLLPEGRVRPVKDTINIGKCLKVLEIMCLGKLKKLPKVFIKRMVHEIVGKAPLLLQIGQIHRNNQRLRSLPYIRMHHFY